MATKIVIEELGCEEKLVKVYPHGGGLFQYGWVPGGAIRRWGESKPFASMASEASLIRYVRELWGRHPVVVEKPGAMAAVA